MILLEIDLKEKELFYVASSEIIFSNGFLNNISTSMKNIYLMISFNSNISFNGFNGEFFSQTFVYSTKCNITIFRLNLFGNPNYFHSVLISESNKQVIIEKSIFVGFNNLDLGAIQNFNTFFILFSSVFMNNNAINTNGGAVYTSNSNISFDANIFSNNSADYGGAIFFNCDNIDLNLMLSSNNFTHNKAKIGGGAFFSVYNVPNYSINDYSENSAEYGDDYASPPIRLSLVNNTNLQNMLQNYLPSSVISYDIILYLKDILYIDKRVYNRLSLFPVLLNLCLYLP